jgi:hypothetical protein
MLHQSNGWGLIISNVADGTRPANAFGTSITPGNNTFPAYTQIMTATSDEAFMIEININANDVSTAARDTLVTIGFDFAGGTTYADMTIADLIGSCATGFISGAGVLGIGMTYRFPVRVPAGTTIAAKASVNNATVGTLSVWVKLFCKPDRPELVRYGTFVRTYGATEATSTGTAITPGTTSDGTYVDLGAISDDIWAWEVGYGINNATINARSIHVDLAVGDATTKKIAILNHPIATGTSETMSKAQALAYLAGHNGDHVYVRSQVGSGAADTGNSVIAYGVGG